MHCLGADFILCLSEITARFDVMLSTTKVKSALQINIPLSVTMNRKKETTDQIKFLGVTIRQQIKLVFDILYVSKYQCEVLSLHSVSCLVKQHATMYYYRF